MSALVEAFCAMCRRTAYVHGDAEMACPVCASPLVDVAAGESQAG